MYVHPNENV